MTVIVVNAGQIVPELGTYHFQQLIIVGPDQGTRTSHIEQEHTQRRTHDTNLRETSDTAAHGTDRHRTNTASTA
ncbi:hypothetical protein AB5J72_00780 [Streptomyces sp. CG1]|uniref:hypothetical protein n=1 Tax=Streptomyces sp. CG1 TaxID=1287523 RepID=UPI0034E252D1